MADLWLGANDAYDLVESDGRRWPILDALKAQQVLIPSHCPASEIDRLIAACPALQVVHVRVKGNRKWWPGDKPIDSVEWFGTPSIRRTLDTLLYVHKDAAFNVVLVWFNEPDIELPPDGQEGGVWQADIEHYRAEAWDQYIRAVETGWDDAIDVWGHFERFSQAFAPLSQGNPERFAWWLAKYRTSDLWREQDVLVDHNYFPAGVPFDDPDWGGRHLRLAQEESKPVDITETNDNNTIEGPVRAFVQAAYAQFVASKGKARSLSLFTLPGSQRERDEPGWWLIDLETATAARAGADRGSAMRQPPAPPVPAGPQIIKAVDVSSNNPDRSQATVNGWVAQGAQLLVVKSYSNAEPQRLQATTREWCAYAEAAGLWHQPYCWLYGTVSATDTVTSSALLWEGITGKPPAIMFLDAEEYNNADGSIDRGPTVAQLAEAFAVCRQRGMVPIIYTGKWWLDALAGREDISRLKGVPAWIADYRDPPEATLDVPNPYGLKIVGRQYTSKPQDWSVFDLAQLTALILGEQSPDGPQEPHEPEKPPESKPDATGAELARVRAELVDARSKLGVLTVDYAKDLASIAIDLPKANKEIERANLADRLKTVILAMRALKPA